MPPQCRQPEEDAPAGYDAFVQHGEESTKEPKFTIAYIELLDNMYLTGMLRMSRPRQVHLHINTVETVSTTHYCKPVLL
jgi:hypothetical protein